MAGKKPLVIINGKERQIPAADSVDVTAGGTGVNTLPSGQYVKGAGTSPVTTVATIPNTDITGLGTMSTQSASSVAITGGTIAGISSLNATGESSLTGLKFNTSSLPTADAFIYRPGDNTLVLGVGSTERARITTTGIQITGALTVTNGISSSDGATGSYTTWKYNGTALGDVGTANQVFSGGSTADFGISSRGGNLLLGTSAGNVRAVISSTGLAITGDLTVTNGISPSNGGTGTTTIPSNGQLLIGNGIGYTVATLTAGTNMSVVNNAGTITLNATAQNTFSNISSSGNATIVADSATDTLTVVAGSGITLATSAATDTLTIATTGAGLRNKIINGGMLIDQRNNGVAVTTPVSSIVYQLDRWASVDSGNIGGAREVQQSTDAPPSTKFLRSLKNTQITASLTTLSINYCTRQLMELANVSSLAGGDIVVSFWYKSNRVGNHGVGVGGNYAAGTVGGLGYLNTFTVSVADTWEYKTVVANSLQGVTSWGSTLLTDAALSLRIGFRVDSNGLTSVALGDYYAITGVQLESGAVTTITAPAPFEDRHLGLELALCQRYYIRYNYPSNVYVGNLQAFTASKCFGVLVALPITMRAVPSTSMSSILHFSPYSSSGGQSTTFTGGSLDSNTPNTLGTSSFEGSSGLAAGDASIIINNTANAWIAASAEL